MNSHSFRLMDCITAVVKTLFIQRFTCYQVKTRAIIIKVVTFFAVQQVMNDVKEVCCISLMIHSSDRLNLRPIRFLIRCCHPEKVKVNLGGETSDLLPLLCWNSSRGLNLMDK